MKLQSLKKCCNYLMAVIEFKTPLSSAMLIGVMLSSSLLDLSTLFGGGGEGCGLKKSFKLHAYYSLKGPV